MKKLTPYDYNGLELYHISPVNHDGKQIIIKDITNDKD